ncbi:MAG TPA: DedA family protein [Elusimicrobiales bacterium]|nr:DedA family protein [Elusimicrobiales bacterium]
MEWIRLALDMFLHLDKHLNSWAGALGPWLYLLLFAIIFCETGLVIMPYLPGDSLLFAVGALAARPGSPIDLVLMCFLLSGAAILGDTVNYAIGKWLGPKVFHRDDSKWLDRRHLDRAHKFYEKYGGKTIVLARFLPIIRTFAPFVAGIGTMGYAKFVAYNIFGGILWTCSFLLLGYRFAELPAVKNNFHYVILAIIIISVIPVITEYLKARKEMSADPAV